MAIWNKLFEREYTIQYWEKVPYMLVPQYASFVIKPVKNLVIGTKTATKVLNDGDFVEVNGDTSEMRKIE